MTQLEATKQVSTKGVEYWMARSIQPVLGYAAWDKFTNVIRKAMLACEGTGTEPGHHFSQTANMVEIGSGAKRPEQDYFLSRYGCYLVAMNGDATKPEVAAAQTYFAVQTRRQELTDNQERMLADVDKRLALRQRLTDATKHLNSAAKQAGVQSYALFAHAGYVGLYGMGLNLTFATGGGNLRKCLQIKAPFQKVCTTAFESAHSHFVVSGDLRWRLRGQLQLQLSQQVAFKHRARNATKICAWMRSSSWW
jgi:hypothetical protein